LTKGISKGDKNVTHSYTNMNTRAKKEMRSIFFLSKNHLEQGLFLVCNTSQTKPMQLSLERKIAQRNHCASSNSVMPDAPGRATIDDLVKFE